MEIKEICAAVSAVFGFLMSYFALYYFVGTLCRRKKYPEATVMRRFAVIIAARNEERVLGALLESLRLQDYPKELFDVFCVADNCSDGTARIAWEGGAAVYERFEPARARKGYALEFLFRKIDDCFGISSYDAYVFFDADNTAERDFLTQMNRALDGGADIVTGYRMASNFGDNYVSAAYGIHFLRSSAFSHRPRSLLGLSTHVAGTGFGVKSELLAEGWQWFSLTEDTELTAWAVSRGKRIEYCEDARFYDEQPTSFRISVRQRIRWQKGRLFCFFRYAPALVAGIFTKRGKRALSCYDMFFYLFPKSLFNFLLAVAAFFSALPSFDSRGFISSCVTACLSFAAIGALAVIRERKSLPRCGAMLAVYILLFPWFDLIALPLSVISLFMRVKWKPIPHTGGMEKKSVFTCKTR